MRTSEFLITFATIIGAVAAAIQGSLSPKWAAIAAAVSTAAYAVSRGLAKTSKAVDPLPTAGRPAPPPAA